MAKQDRDVLPDRVKPVNYDVSLYDLELGGEYSYKGTAKIELHVLQATKEIVLNAAELKLQDAQVEGSKAQSIDYDEKKQRVVLSFAKEISPNKSKTLEINFTGTMNNKMAGFYRSKYKPAATPAPSVPTDGEHHFMFSTQFESCDARRAIPCFDEPNLKATFDFSIEIPEDQTALSNMPENEVKPGKSGRKVVSFERTPIMSTYLLAWAFGDFEYVEDFTKRKYGGKQLPVRVYTTRGLKEQARFGLLNAHRIVDFFSEVFHIDYPLPKADLLAVHEFSHGAMENWGLVTYRTTAILFDEKHSDAKYKNRVAYVVAHELAHQWFGNLVTMDWWSELWLNEGFATWVGWFAIDHFYPEWEVFSQFVAESLQLAFSLDALRSSHPIEVPVKDALEIDQIFDHISYLKGSSVIRMLSNALGTDVFLKGVSAYLKSHAYGNATTNDLWSALSEVSGKNVTEMMDPWIRKIGFPVVTIAEEPGQIQVRQARYLSTGDVKPAEDETHWWIPLLLKTKAGVDAQALALKEDTIRDIDDSFYKLNSDSNGFYKVNYPPKRLLKLGEARRSLTTQDRIGLIADAAALAQSGEGTTAGLLALLEGFQDETNYLVWSRALMSVSKLRQIFSENKTIANGLKAYTLKLVIPATEKIGWDVDPNEDLLKSQLRSLLLTSAGGAGHQPTVNEAKKRFSAYFSGNKNAIHPNLRLAILRLCVENGGKEEYELVKQEYLNTASVDGKETCLQAMGHVQTSDLTDDFMQFQFSDKVATQDNHTGSIQLAMNTKARDAFWVYFKANWDKIYAKLSGNMVVLDRYIKNTLNRFTSHEMDQDIKNFFKGKDTKGFDRGLEQVLDTVKASADYKARDMAIIEEWLKAHKHV